MTVSRMMAEMPNSELMEWMALDTIRNKNREQAERMARMKNNKSRGRRR